MDPGWTHRNRLLAGGSQSISKKKSKRKARAKCVKKVTQVAQIVQFIPNELKNRDNTPMSYVHVHATHVLYI